ncbi:ATPase [Streptococcus sp. HMSC067A03]|uniref:ATP-binding protein n=1 Tax=Streptococcus sp. HMSC067A03 TaxID=1739467 RepID=UPI0008A10F56|nr:ATP-binding protein [Streptococcus sp. HMSC067A03]OFP95803.1 ATPase [Streptococcus sp. HMSC067A03]
MAEKVKEVSFKSTTRTVNLLGRDNILDYRSAILELVKNSYDAFSNQVNIRIIGEDITVNKKKDKKATSIEIIDYGQGMSLDKIINVFFTLGTDDKTHTTSIKYQKSERVMNGSMGIGRLSLGRLGNISRVITSDGREAYRFSIDWNSFTTGGALDTVKVNIEQLSLSEFTSEYTNRGLENPNASGTILIASDLKDEWLLSDKGQSGTNYSLLKLTLNKLKNPLKLEKSGEFKIILDYFEEKEEIEPSLADVSTDAEISFAFSHDSDMLILDGYFDEIDISQLPPDFVNAKFDKLKDYIQDNNGEKRSRYHFELEYKISEYIPDKMPNNPIGDFDGVLYFTKKTGSNKYPFLKRPAMGTNTVDIDPGILLYRDGFRIRPYGEIDTIGFDWLGIEKERSKNPAGVGRSGYMMQANQLSGYVNITKKNNRVFEDQSNREGLKNSVEFEYLQSVILRIIKDFSFIRSEIIILYNEFLKETADVPYFSEKGKKTKKMIYSLINKNKGNLQELYKDPEYQALVSNPQSLFEMYSLQDITEEENSSLVTESDTLRTMATQGIVMSTFAHQIKNDKKFFQQIPQNLIDTGDYYSEHFNSDFHEIEQPYNLYDFAKAVGRKTTNILGFLESSVNNPIRDKKEKINLSSYLFKIYSWWDNSVKDNFYSYDYLVNGKSSRESLPEQIKNIYIYASETQLDSIFLNLITNSYKNFKYPKKIKHRIINIELEVVDCDLIKITYEDNGNGLNKNIKNSDIIFEAYKSYTKGGTGLGMTILASVISNLRGDKELLSNPGESGFKIRMTLKGGVE